MKQLKKLDSVTLLRSSFLTTMGGLAILYFSKRLKSNVHMLPLYKPKTGLYFYIYKYIAVYLQSFIFIMQKWVSPAISVILITIIVKLILIPISLLISRYSLINNVHRQNIQPQLNLIDDTLRFEPVDKFQRTMLLNLKNKALVRNNAVMHQWPIYTNLIVQTLVITCLYQSIAYTDILRHSTFMNINLATPNTGMAILASTAYLLSNLAMTTGMTKKERSTLPLTTYWLTPTTIFCSGYFLPSIICLYWITSASFSTIENIINYWIMRPKLRKKETKWQPITVVTKDEINKILHI